jgi:hypothetical protein
MLPRGEPRLTQRCKEQLSMCTAHTEAHAAQAPVKRTARLSGASTPCRLTLAGTQVTSRCAMSRVSMYLSRTCVAHIDRQCVRARIIRSRGQPTQNLHGRLTRCAAHCETGATLQSDSRDLQFNSHRTAVSALTQCLTSQVRLLRPS